MALLTPCIHLPFSSLFTNLNLKFTCLTNLLTYSNGLNWLSTNSRLLLLCTELGWLSRELYNFTGGPSSPEVLMILLATAAFHVSWAVPLKVWSGGWISIFGRTRGMLRPLRPGPPHLPTQAPRQYYTVCVAGIKSGRKRRVSHRVNMECIKKFWQKPSRHKIVDIRTDVRK
jgi:hypothetical protein